MQLEVTINADGRSCTVNQSDEPQYRCSGKPYCCYGRRCAWLQFKENQKEAGKVYEIEAKVISEYNHETQGYEYVPVHYKPHTTHSAVIINGKAKIL